MTISIFSGGVSEQGHLQKEDTFTPRKVLVIPWKRWLRPDMTRKLFTGMLSLNKTKNNHSQKKQFPKDGVRRVE